MANGAFGNVLPPGRSGQVKEPLVADTTLSDVAGIVQQGVNILEVIENSDASNSVDEFQGIARTKQLEFTNRLKQNPGAPQEQIDAWQQDMLSDIRKAGAKTIGKARKTIGDWYKNNEGFIIERSTAKANSIRVERQLERADINYKAAINRGDIAGMRHIAREQVKNNLWDQETAELRLQQDMKNVLGNQVIRGSLDFEDEAKGLEQIERINELAKKRYGIEKLYGADDIDQLREQYQKQRSYAENTADAAREKAIVATGKDAMNLGVSGDWNGAQEVYNQALRDDLMTEQEFTTMSRNLETVSGIVAEGKPNPMEVTTNWTRYGEIKRDVIAGRKTKAEIYREVGVYDRKTNTGGIGKAEASLLEKMIETGGTSDDSENIATSKKFTALFDDAVESFDFAFDTVIEESLAKSEGHRRLEAFYRDKPKATPREKEEAAFRIFEDLVQEGEEDKLPTTSAELREIRANAEKKSHRDFLQSIWDDMSKEERVTAMKALKQGKTPKEIIAYLEANNG